MPVDYTIFKDPTLVYIRYFDHVEPNDIICALRLFTTEAREYAQQPHFFDLSSVKSYAIDYNQFFKLLGQLADVYPQSSGEHLCVFFAPDGPPAELADILRKPFEGSDTMLIRLARTRQQAFDILGSPRKDLIKHMETQA